MLEKTTRAALSSLADRDRARVPVVALVPIRLCVEPIERRPAVGVQLRRSHCMRRLGDRAERTEREPSARNLCRLLYIFAAPRSGFRPF